MAPLIVLVVMTLLARLTGHLGVRALSDWAAATRAGLAVMFCFTATAHFNSMRADMIRMVPPAVPNPGLMVTLTGICEIFGGIGLLVPKTRRLAAVGLIVLLIAVLPANVHAGNAGIPLRGAPPTPVIPRIALQIFFMALIWWAGIRDERRQPAIGSGIA